MPVKTVQVPSHNLSNDKVLNIFNHQHHLLVKLHHINGCIICCYVMLVIKKTVLNENYLRVHVRWTKKSGN